MKEIILKRITLLNFKGARELSIDFNQSLTNIFGRNGSGKTTVFDAFTWLLFGKDSQDRKKFDLKTIDNAGIIIPQIPHEVSAVITVNGEEVRLTRRFTEKWVKRAGQTDLVFTGNEEERFYNDVPCSQREYEAKIAEICNETVFKFITSPTYFTAQSAEAQKSMLSKMAGSISDSEIAAGNADFESLLNAITGKTLEEYKKEISAKKSRLNAEIAGIPDRIDEKKRDLADDEDWAALESECAAKREERKAIEAQLEEAAEAQRAVDLKLLESTRRLGEIRRKRVERVNALTNEARKEYYAQKQSRDELLHQIKTLNRENETDGITIKNAEREVKECASTRERLVAEFLRLNKQSEEINAEQLTLDESQFICPTCRRPLDVADIEEKEAALMQNFEKEREKRLQRVAADIAENSRLGKANNEKRARYETQIADAKERIENRKKQITELEASDTFKTALTEPDVMPVIAADSEIQTLDKEIAQLESETAENAPQTSNAELKSKRDELTREIESLTVRLGKRESNNRAKSRISELEKQYQTLNAEIAELEKAEFTITEFSKARSAAIEARINGLFSIVRFRWIAPQINGAEKETCEATLNGKPYSTCSNAEKTLIGLDIINAICKSQGVYAPIFVDNAESVNDIVPMKSQVICLVVSRDEKLIIEPGTAQKNLFQ